MKARKARTSFWNRRYEAVEQLWTPEPNAFLVELAAGLPPGRALDVGAGEGRNAVWLAQRGWRVTALDISGVALARAARRAAEEGVELDCVEADWRDYRPAAASLDLVVISFVHPEPGERTSMLAWARSALAPGAHLFVVGVDRSDHGRRGPPGPERLYTPDDLRQALEGLEVLRCDSVTLERELEDGARRVVDVVAVARRTRPAPGQPATR